MEKSITRYIIPVALLSRDANFMYSW